ncbi:putative beta-N-acetylhexosaminidase [Paenibacillus sp. 598K]|nr:putative beta-N-acetylhexosaminidase [Paenibacillus sp. 598K]
MVNRLVKGCLAFVVLWGVMISLGNTGKAQAAEKPLTIPALQQWTGGSGYYNFGAASRIAIDPAYTTQLTSIANVLADDLLQLTGLAIPVVSAADGLAGDIVLTLGTTDPVLGADGYVMDVTDRIVINGKNANGTFNGTRSVLQLLKQGFAIPSGTAKDWAAYPERALSIDIGRKYFTMTFLKNRIRELAYLKYNMFHLHFSDNEGFRIESVSHPEIVSQQHLTKAQVTELIQYAASYHITIVPELDMPGHMKPILASRPDLQLTRNTGLKEPDLIDLSLPASYDLMEELLQEYLPLFPGPYFHIGADEYLHNYDPFPQLQAYATANYGAGAVASDTYQGFINWANDIVKSYGKTTRIWNDGIKNSTAAPLDTDIQAEYWRWDPNHPSLTPQQLLDRGQTILNTNSEYLYYVLGRDWKPNPAAVYEQFTPSLFPGGYTIADNHPKNLGASLAIWCDNADSETEGQVELGVQNTLRSLSQVNWGSPKLAASYSAFLPLISHIGSAPGYTGSSSFSKAGNLALGKKATASSSETPSETTSFTPENAIDGDSISSRWSSQYSDAQWLQVDLGATYSINEVVLNWQTAYGKSFQIQVSQDGSVWHTMYSTTTGNGGIQELTGLSGTGRYVRMLGTQRGTAFGYSLYEFQVFGTSPNLAQYKTATASSVEPSTTYTAGMAVDGNTNTRWSSQHSDPQWLQVDLEDVYDISKIVLNWETAYAKTYQIQISNDGIGWTTLYSTTSGAGGVHELDRLSVSGRYIRVYCTERGTPHGYSLHELQVFGANLALGKPATASSVETATSYFPNLATDGASNTRWSSQSSDPQWLRIDLGTATSVKRVVLNWERAYGKAYQLQMSNDGIVWTTIYSTTSATGGIQDIGGLSGNGRYLRLYGTQRALTPHGYSLYDLQVYGDGTVGTNHSSYGFSGIQGANQWSYQETADLITYTNMTYDPVGKRWQGTGTSYVYADSQHPGATTRSARVWTADAPGTRTVSGSVRKANPNGNGVNLKIMKGSTQVWPAGTGWQLLSGADMTGTTFNFNVNLNAGEKLFFVLDGNGDVSYDSTLWDVTISSNG